MQSFASHGHPSSTKRQDNSLYASDYNNIDELIRDSTKILTAGGLLPAAAVWNRMFRLLSDQKLPLRKANSNDNHMELGQQIAVLHKHTMSSLCRRKPKELTTIILSSAKIAQHIQRAMQKRCMNRIHCALANVFLDDQSNPRRDLFNLCAKAANEKLPNYEARYLSNLAYAYGLLGYNPQLDSNGTLLGNVAEKAVTCTREFEPQGYSNVLWAYATLEFVHPNLFQAIGKAIVCIPDLKAFTPQALSNIVWAYAKAQVHHPELFDKVASHIVERDELKSFHSQALSNIVWAYASLHAKHGPLIKKIGDHIARMPDLKSFDAQAISNIVWAYATMNREHPSLFERVGHYILELNGLESFGPQAISNIVWAYATSNLPHPSVFKKIADTIVESNDSNNFNSQSLATIVWSFATANEPRPNLFQKIGDAIAYRDIASFNPQDLSNIAWSYAAANCDTPMLFNATFVKALCDRIDEFTVDQMRQLYQWHLWQNKEHSHVGLPKSIQKCCRGAFVSAGSTASLLQQDIVSELKAIGFDPVEEYVTASGYSLDACIKVNHHIIGIEADGPSHFIGGKPTACTLLKRRQVRGIDKIPLVSVPYWEWDALGCGSAKKQQYLRCLLDSIGR
ncbi:hypothetical protein ACHAXN_004803 [Cyclotella atomus]